MPGESYPRGLMSIYIVGLAYLKGQTYCADYYLDPRTTPLNLWALHSSFLRVGMELNQGHL